MCCEGQGIKTEIMALLLCNCVTLGELPACVSVSLPVG